MPIMRMLSGLVLAGSVALAQGSMSLQAGQRRKRVGVHPKTETDKLGTLLEKAGQPELIHLRQGDKEAEQNGTIERTPGVARHLRRYASKPEMCAARACLSRHAARRDRTDVFFSQADRETYLHLIQDNLDEAGVRVLGWCLMTNHVHWVVVPMPPPLRAVLSLQNSAESVRTDELLLRYHLAFDRQIS